MKKVLAMMMAMAMTLGMAACGGSSTSTSPSTQPSQSAAPSESKAPEAQKVSGKVTMSGSTSMEKLVKMLIEVYGEVNDQISLSVEFPGSGAGITACLDGTVDIGNSSRNLKEEEKAQGAVENIVAIDGIAVVVNPQNGVEELSQEQLADIYTGAVTNWKEVGGADAPIVVVGRESGSGTRGAFEELLDVEDKCAYAQELNSTGAVKTTVASTPDAIGYISLDVLDDTVKSTKIDGVEATEENIKAGSYALSRPFVMATKGEISQASPAAQEFLNWVLSDEGQAVVKEAGLITVK